MTDGHADALVLVDATASSLTVSWPEGDQKGTDDRRYVLEYRANDGDGAFRLLSDKLQSTQARKRNLDASTGAKGYWFRARSADRDGWYAHLAPFRLLTSEQESSRMDAPSVVPAGTNRALLVSWKTPPSASSSAVELQMRENRGGAPWQTIASKLTSDSVRKKNLTSTLGYQFRVRPADGGASTVFSPPSEPVVPRGLSPGIQRFFAGLEDGTLLRNGVKDPVPLADALGGREFVLLYASAHWCPPCRKFTPMLAHWYRQNSSAVEVVFLSCDHDEASFRNYFDTSHPWTAVDFDDDAREQLLAAIKVQGIPRLVVMSGITGKIIEQNAVGQQLDVNRWRTMAATGK